MFVELWDEYTFSCLVYEANEPACSTEVHVKFPAKMKPLLSCDVGALCPLFGVGLINVLAVSVSGLFKADLFIRLYWSCWFFHHLVGISFWKMFDNLSGSLLILSSSLSYYSAHTVCKNVKLVLIGHMIGHITYGLIQPIAWNCFQGLMDSEIYSWVARTFIILQRMI